MKTFLYITLLIVFPNILFSQPKPKKMALNKSGTIKIRKPKSEPK